MKSKAMTVFQSLTLIVLAGSSCRVWSQELIVEFTLSEEARESVEHVGQSHVPREESIYIASFNIRNLSDRSRDDEEMANIAMVCSEFDLIAIQEVRDVESLERLCAEIPWSATYTVSDLIGRSQKERYAFVFNHDYVRQKTAITKYDDHNDDFRVEPVMARFRSGSFDFALVTVHLIWGRTVGERRAEAERLLDVICWAQYVYGGDERDIILLGDFNQGPDSPGFLPIKTQLDYALAPIFADASVCSSKIEDTALYDNVWINEEHTGEFTGNFGISMFDEWLYDNDDNLAKLQVSDHRPVWAQFYTADRIDDD